MKNVLLYAAALTLGACRGDQPPAPTSQESAQLNEAEDLLNDLAHNEEGPEQSPGPSNSSD